jgi:DNA polymerase-3 subunit alpha
MTNLVHLHRHSDFSLLDGLGTAEHYAKRAAELGQGALALTDHGSLAGVLYHVEACNDVGVKPIVGMEAYFRPDIEADRNNKNTYGSYHLILLARNKVGFRNLMRLSSLSYREDNFYYKPCINWKLLREHSEGLIGSSSCISGILPKMLLEENHEEVEKTLRIFQDIFGEDFYLETQPHNIPEQRKVNIELINLANKTGIPVVAAVDAHYPYKEWSDTQDIAVMISTQSSLKKRKQADEDGKNYLKFITDTLWLMSEEELMDTFKENHSDIPESYINSMISNSTEIANRCEEFNYDKSPKIPKATKTPLEAESIIREWCVEGLKRIGRSDKKVYLDRIEEEIETIKKLGTLDYFVIVGDMVRWAKDQGIRVGPGRGSAAGSLINYLIRITAIDPIGYELLFERFLNEYRTELPDIDIDFQDDRRDEVKQYLIDKWGEDHVVNIAAFQSFGLKGVIQDVSRVLDIPYAETLRATNNIPDKAFGLNLEDIEKSVEAVKNYLVKYPEVRKHAMRLFGQMARKSKHAAGVIITDRPAQDLIPMMTDKEGHMVTQWTERANAQLISPYGFLKIDCLATDGLTKQDMTIKMIKKTRGIEIDFEDVNQFPFLTSPFEVDKRVVRAFSTGNNLGIFQFESKGISSLLKLIKPHNIDHIIAANALYRPGTLENGVAFDYARRKNNLVAWKLPHPNVKPFLGDTFGFMIYQEQMMQMYQALAEGVTPSESATFLKVASKGIARDLEGKKRIQKYYEKFESGCIKKNIPKESYDLIWDQILQMTTYAFNRSHSAGYAVQAYQDQYLKTYYPLEFYTSLLTLETEKIPQIIRESKNFGIKILPPDINISDEGFTIDGNSIRFGLLGIKFVGPSAIEEIKNKRPFKSFEDLLERCTPSKVKSNVRQALFKSGAFDQWGARNEWVLDDSATQIIQGGLSQSEIFILEKEVTGFVISKSDSINTYEKIISDTIDKVYEKEDGEEVCVGGEVTNFKEITTKKGDKMAFVNLQFKNDDYALTIFPKEFKKYFNFLAEGNTVLAIGDWDIDRQTVVVKNMCTAEELDKELRK